MATRLDSYLNPECPEEDKYLVDKIREEAERVGEGWVWKNFSDGKLHDLWADFSTDCFCASFLRVDYFYYQQFSNWLKEEI